MPVFPSQYTDMVVAVALCTRGQKMKTHWSPGSEFWRRNLQTLITVRTVTLLIAMICMICYQEKFNGVSRNVCVFVKVLFVGQGHCAVQPLSNQELAVRVGENNLLIIILSNYYKQ